MKSKRIKQVLLALLALVLVYIWWGNLKLFVQSEPDTTCSSDEAIPAKAKQPSSSSFKYLPPKTNPFRRYVSQPGAAPGMTRPSQIPPPVEYLHVANRLNGILPKGKSSQVIVLTQQKKSAVLEIGDSLGTWQLVGIGETCAAFKQGKRNDTLWLVPPKK